MAEVGLGWIGWTEDQVLWCDINALRIAYMGRVDMLQAIFGKAPDPRAPPPPPTGGGGKPVVMTPKIFDSMFGKPAGKG